MCDGRPLICAFVTLHFVAVALSQARVLRVVTTKPYTVMQIEVGIPDDPYVEGEGARWGVAEGTSLAELEMQVFDTVNTVVELMNKLAPPMDVNEKRTLSEWFKTYVSFFFLVHFILSCVLVTSLLFFFLKMVCMFCFLDFGLFFGILGLILVLLFDNGF